MPSMLKRKRTRVALVGLAALVFSAGAVAYFTASGTGSGNTPVGTSTAMTITATIAPVPGGLVPGGTPAAVTFNVNNPSSGYQYVNTITMTGVQAFSDAGHTNNITGTGATQCDTSQFTMVPVTEAQEVQAGSSGLPVAGSLVFHDSGANQDGCKGAYLVASFSSN